MQRRLMLLSLALFAVFIAPILASESPSVTVTPPSIPTGGTVTITITAASPNTKITSIKTSGPPNNPGPWTWSGVPITMPDIGDAVSITFPGNVFTIVNDPNNNIVGGTGAWSTGANTGTTGSYWTTVAGQEFASPPKSFIVQQEFNVPEFATATTLITAIGFAGFVLGRRRFKIKE